MPLSSNTLIHFTNEAKALEGILASDFKVHYCKETFTLQEKEVNLRVPMISFCDIPLSQIKEHISKYGNYGIGMTREWGRRNGLNPVLYMANGSNLSSYYKTAYNHHVARKNVTEMSPEDLALMHISAYIKNYEGNLNRQGVVTENYRYSDEREWRYVPPHDISKNIRVYSDAQFNSKKAIIEAAIEKTRIEFTPCDIKYIIIKNESEIGQFIDILRRTKGKKYTLDDVERLTTRILTSEQILDDI